MIEIIVAMACLAFGLYAGKRRANGAGWYSIACDLAKGVWGIAEKAWSLIAYPFKKDKVAADKNTEAAQAQHVA